MSETNHQAIIRASSSLGTGSEASVENGSKAFEKIMGGEERPTVVIGGNDVSAVGL